MNAPLKESRCPVAHDFDPFRHESAEFFKQARKERPVFFHEQLNAYVVTRFKDCERVLKASSEEVSADVALRPNVPPNPEALRILGESGFVPAPSMVDEDGWAHRLHRWSSQSPFSAARIKPLEGFVRRQVDQRLDAIVKKGAADIVDDLIYEVPAALILHMMGVPDEQMGMIKDFRGPWGVFGWGYPTDEEQITVAKGIAAFGKWARELSDDRRANRRDDIISEAITNLENTFTLDVNWLRSWTLNVVMAGHETTTNTMAGGMISLLTHRDQWEALCADPSLCDNAADEILRHDTGVPTWRQRAVKEIELSGVKIPAGSKMYVALSSANRDEEIFGDDADRFDVRRKNANRHIAFGSGVHVCLGQVQAHMEIRVMLEELVRRLPHLQIVPDQTYTYSRNTTQRGPEHVKVTWDASRNPIAADRA